MPKKKPAVRGSIWLVRCSVALLLVFIFTIGLDAVERYNSTAWWGLTVAAILAWLFAEWALRYINASPAMQYLLVGSGSVALYADSFGTMASLYSGYYWYDNMMHFIGTAAITLWLWYVMRAMAVRRKIRLPLSWHMWLVFATAGFFGILFEIVEYSADRIFLEGHYWIGPAPDTAEDILWNTIGAATAVLSMGWSEKK